MSVVHLIAILSLSVLSAGINSASIDKYFKICYINLLLKTDYVLQPTVNIYHGTARTGSSNPCKMPELQTNQGTGLQRNNKTVCLFALRRPGGCTGDHRKKEAGTALIRQCIGNPQYHKE